MHRSIVATSQETMDTSLAIARTQTLSTMPGPGTSRQLLNVIRLVSKLDLVVLEETGQAEAQKAALELLAQTERVGELLDALLGELEQQESPSAGLAFIARMSVSQKRESLRSAAQQAEFWQLMGAMGSAKREVIRSVDRLLAELSLASGIAYERHVVLDQLQAAIATRAAYHRFRRSFSSDPEGTPEILARRLRSGANTIAVLIGREIYPRTRIGDRAALRSMQSRLRAALASYEPTEAWANDAKRVWCDLSNLSQFFMEVNRRSELMEHDAMLMGDLAGRLERRELDGSGACATAEPLLGRDAEIDALLEARSADANAWATALRSAQATLISRPSFEAPAAFA